MWMADAYVPTQSRILAYQWLLFLQEYGLYGSVTGRFCLHTERCHCYLEDEYCSEGEIASNLA